MSSAATDAAAGAGPRAAGPVGRTQTEQTVLGVAALMVAAHLAVRAWMLYPSWFYTDDYRFLADARSEPFGVAYLTSPFDNQFMPLGRLLAWVVSHAGDAPWSLAASLTCGLQLLASASCVWMLVTLFGARWGVLAPLGVYLTCSVTAPALMWWAASLNQLPLQVVFFASVAAWVTWLRGRRARWLVVTMVLVVVGLLSYVKTVLVLLVLAALLVGWFSSGPFWPRVRQAVRTGWPALVTVLVLGGTFAVYYTTQVPSIFEPTSWRLAGQLADSMLGSAIPSGLTGGPWRWDTTNPPTAYADPPGWLAHLSWLLIAGVALLAWATRERTGRVWALLGGYSLAVYALVLVSRAPIAGALLGREYRYVTDVVPVAVLCLGLLFLPVLDCPGATARREHVLLLATPRPTALAVVVAVVCLSGLVSTLRYAQVWHTDNPGADYTQAAMDGLAGRGPVDLADQVVPGDVVPGFSAPYNSTRRLLPLLVDNARFPTSTSRLVVLDGQGRPANALIDPAAVSGDGPVTDCGWLVRSGASVTVPLPQPVFDYSWWVRIGYLGSADDSVEVTIAGETVTAPVARGPHSLFVSVTGAVDGLEFRGLPNGATLCVDTVEVGQPVPGELL